MIIIIIIKIASKKLRTYGGKEGAIGRETDGSDSFRVTCTQINHFLRDKNKITQDPEIDEWTVKLMMVITNECDPQS